MEIAPPLLKASIRLSSLERVNDGFCALEDEANLAIVVVAVAQGARLSGGGDVGPSLLVGKVAADLGCQFVEGGEEDGLLVLAKALEMTLGTLGEQKATAAGDLETLMDELVLVGVSEKAEVDL